jgi:polysaccharide biosynthesis transport protein
MSTSGSLQLRGESAGFSGMPPLSLDDDSGILTRLRRRKLLFVVVFCSVVAVVAGVYVLLPPSYRAEASVTIAAPDAVLDGQGGGAGAQRVVGDPADLESQQVVMSSPLLLRELLDDPEVHAALMGECEASPPNPTVERVKGWLGLKLARPCAERLADLTGEVAELSGRYTITTNGRSRVINVAFVSPQAEVAQLMANKLVEAYLGLRTQERLKPREAAIAWLQAETNRLSERLKSSEATIEAFLHEHGLVKGQVAPIASERLTELAQQLVAAQADLAASGGKLGQAGNATRDVLDSRGVGDLKMQQATVAAQLAQLSTRYGPSNPAIQELQNQKAGIDRAISQEMARVSQSTRYDYQAASSRVATLQAQLDAMKKEVGANDNATTQIATLQRDADVDRELYIDLTKKLNELQTESRLVVGDARLVSLAELPDKVFFPKKLTFGLTGLLLGFTFATVAALLRDRADRTVRGVGGLQAAAGLRVLAHVPQVRRLGRGAAKLTEQVERPSAFQEAIRHLYAECVLVDHNPPVRSILVTSSEPGEGKTFVALSLGYFAALSGKRVLVLECDLRRPTFGQTLGLGSQAGMSELLRGTARVEDVISPGGIAGLDVVMAGRPSIDSTELLSGAALGQLLSWATSRYDLVLIDSPPSRALQDARILARRADGVLYCTQWGRSQMESVLEGVHELQAAGGHMLGLVLDRVETERYRLYDARSMRAAYLTASGD